MNNHLESNLQNNDELKIHEKTVSKFFQDCKNKGLLYNAESNPKILKNAITRADISCLTDCAIEKIRQYRNSLKNNQNMPILSEKEHDALQFSRAVNFLRESTEELTISLQLIFNSNVKPSTQLGTYLTNIYDKLEYDCKKRTKINMAFQKDLRNALSHQDYWYEHDNEHVTSITWKNSNDLHKWDQNKLLQSILKIRCINKLVGEILDDDF